MRPSFVEIDLAAIRHNVAALSTEVAPAALCAVVKADGYGHGDVPVAEAALSAGARYLAVALLEEGIRLREAGIKAPILLLSEPGVGDAAEVVHWGLEPTVYRRELLAALEEAAGEPVQAHLKVDTGMHRVGCDPDEALPLARAVVASHHLELAAVWTHLAVAEEDPGFTEKQIATFAQIEADLAAASIEPGMVHLANTAGALGYPAARADMVRVGLGIYGLEPAPGFGSDLDLRPAMRVVSAVTYVRHLPAGARPSYGRRRSLPAAGTVATVPIGYADGLTRRLSDLGGALLIGGERRRFAGTVTMDQVVVDVGSDPVAVGDEVVVLGSQGDQSITADEWARLLGTINYEVVCTFGPRLPRRYLS